MNKEELDVLKEIVKKICDKADIPTTIKENDICIDVMNVG